MGSIILETNIWLVLLLVGVVYGQVGDMTTRRREPVKTLFCTFADDKYRLHTKEPQFGVFPTSEEEKYILTVQPYNYYGREHLQLNDVLFKLSKLSSHVVWLHYRNDWDPLIKFIRAYKNLRGTKSLASFYEDYHVEFEPHQDGAEFIIEILKQLRESGLSRVANKFFLVSVYKDAPMTANNTELPDWQYSHVAGAVRIAYGEDRRKGYIVLDPGLGMYKPVVLMDDGMKPHCDHDLRVIDRFTFHRIPNRDIYFALVKDIDEEKPREKHFYYLEAPFCSFLDTTLKRQLLAIDQQIMARDDNGEVQAYFGIKLLPPDILRRVSILSIEKSQYYRFYLGFKRPWKFVVVRERPNQFYIEIKPRKDDPTEETSTESENDPLTHMNRLIIAVHTALELERHQYLLYLCRRKFSYEAILDRMIFIREMLFEDEQLMQDIYNLQVSMGIVNVDNKPGQVKRAKTFKGLVGKVTTTAGKFCG